MQRVDRGLDPGVDDGLAAFVEIGELVRRRHANALRREPAVQRRQRHDVLDLALVAGGIAAAQHAELAAAAGGAAKMIAVDDQAAAERRGDQDVEKSLVLLAEPELHFAHGRGGGIVLDEHRHVQRARAAARRTSVDAQTP